jgi:hypothetical protein
MFESYDDKRVYVCERGGECDLQTFLRLRREKNHPLDPNELFLIMHYVAESMAKLHRIGISLCNTKETKIMIRFLDEV